MFCQFKGKNRSSSASLILPHSDGGGAQQSSHSRAAKNLGLGPMTLLWNSKSSI